MTVNFAGGFTKDARKNPLCILFARMQGLHPPPVRCLSARLQFSQESYGTLVKPVVGPAWAALMESERTGEISFQERRDKKDKWGDDAPNLAFKNVVRDAIFGMLSSEEQTSLKCRAEAAKAAQVKEFEVALNRMPSNDPEFIMKYVIQFFELVF